MEVDLVSIGWLKPHEEVKPKNVDVLHEMTLRWSAYTKPLLVDSQTGTILDGHHRYHVGVRLGLSRLPVIMVDYLDDDGIELDVWPASGYQSLTKREVIDMALSEEVFPPKTSRHRFSDHLPPIAIPLDILRIAD
ncbi:MAG: hypothetical protein VYC11_00245 [Candidatus Thermoplasmatota archaeon]|nr:hypothetical protein [Euryarchaeota archaeon]MEC9089778.1 hypothetical protein [Candidatus Thermoplasmatota archaeon]MED5486924.1 hypothetical protein [Candidatus Thermoplasmatota archaeon]